MQFPVNCVNHPNSSKKSSSNIFDTYIWLIPFSFLFFTIVLVRNGYIVKKKWSSDSRALSLVDRSSLQVNTEIVFSWYVIRLKKKKFAIFKVRFLSESHSGEIHQKIRDFFLF